MNDTSPLRTNSLSSKSILPPFQIRGLDQILFHKDVFAQAQARPKPSYALLQQRPQASHIRPQTSSYRKSFPLAIEAGRNASGSESSQENSNSRGHRRPSISDRNIQILRAINDVLIEQVDSLRQELEGTSHNLRERELDLSYISETKLLAKDEIAELRQQIQEKEEIIRRKDALISHKDAEISKQTLALIRKDKEIEDSRREGTDRERILNELKRERKAQINLTIQRTSTSRFREENCTIFADQNPPRNSDLDLMTDKRLLSKQSNITKGKFALKEMLREQREIRSRKAAIKANIRAGKIEEKEREGHSESESRRISEAQSRPSEASRCPETANDENTDPASGDGGRTKSFVRLKSLVGGIRPRVYLSSRSRDFSVTTSEGSSS